MYPFGRKFFEIEPYRYKRYIPNAYDESFTFLQKLNLVIKDLNKLGHLTNEYLDDWEEFLEWIKGKGLEDHVEKILIKWFDNGKLGDLINGTLLKEINDKLDYLMNLEHGLDLDIIEPKFLFEFSGIRNAVNQDINIDDETLQMYSTQSDSQAREGFYITRMSPSGHYMSHMHIVEGGHGTFIALDRHTNGDLKIWLFHDALRRLIQIEYKDNHVMTVAEAQNYTNYTPDIMGDLYFSPSTDPYKDYLALRDSQGYVRVWHRSDIRARNNADPIYTIFIPVKYRNDNNPLQGLAHYDDKLWWQSGWGQIGDKMTITEFDLKTGNITQEKVYDRMAFMFGNLLPEDDYKEPEGLAYYIEPYTGKGTLLIAITSGGIGKRKQLLYGISERGGDAHWDSIRALTTQTYQFIRGTGQAKRVPEGWNDLNDPIMPGYYSLTNAEASAMLNMPYPAGEQSWRMTVTPYNQVFEKEMIMERISSVKRSVIFKRTLGYRYQDNSQNYGRWNAMSMDTYYGEYLNPTDWDNKLSNMLIAGMKFYITANGRADFSAIPDSLIPADIGGTVWNDDFSVGDENQNNVSHFQYFLTNSSLIYRKIARRIVNTRGVVQSVGDWFIVDDVGSIGSSYSEIPLEADIRLTSSQPFRIQRKGDFFIIRGSLDIPFTNNKLVGMLPSNMTPSETWVGVVPANDGSMRKVIVRTNGQVSAFNPPTTTGATVVDFYLMVPVN